MSDKPSIMAVVRVDDNGAPPDTLVAIRDILIEGIKAGRVPGIQADVGAAIFVTENKR